MIIIVIIKSLEYKPVESVKSKQSLLKNKQKFCVYENNMHKIL